MARRQEAVMAMIVLLASACAGGGSDDVQVAGGTASGAQPADTGSTAAATGTDSGTGTPAGGIECVLSDDGIGFEVLIVNEGDAASTYQGEIELLDGSAVLATSDLLVFYVAPGERVREYLYIPDEAEDAATTCSAAGVEAVVEPVPDLGRADVSACLNPRRSEFGTYAYDLEITNNSATVTAYYTIRMAIRGPDGERLEGRIQVVPESGGVAPGESLTTYDETLSLDYRDDLTCEVISADKQTLSEFFGSATGATTGSLNADVAFATGSAELTDDARVLLAGAIEQIIAWAGPVCVEGFADSVGNDEDNLALSQARAEAVADHLRTSGATNEIDAVGRGERDATADEVDDPAQRRVDITLSACAP